MFHTVVYQASLGATADTDCPAITDNIMLIQNNHIVPQQDMQIIYAYAGAVTLLRSKFTSPSLRQFSPPFIRPIDTVASPSSRTPIADYRQNPLTIKALEELAVQSTDSATGPNVGNIVVGLQYQPNIPAQSGQIITMRGTGATAVTANAWSTAAMTWADTLPAGTYQCVGLSGFSATGITARLIFDQQYYRPGAVIGANGGIIPHSMFLKGGLGVWGTFTANRMPNIEFFCTSADNAQEVYLDLVRIA